VITRPEKLNAFRIQKKWYKFTLYVILIKTYNLKTKKKGGGGFRHLKEVTKLPHHLSMDEYAPILKYRE
jgi:hypothetical protein